MNTIAQTPAITPAVTPPAAEPKTCAKIIGVGGAGASVVEELIRGGFDAGRCVVLHSPPQILGRCAAAQTIQLSAAASLAGAANAAAASSHPSLDQLKESVAGTAIVYLTRAQSAC